MVTRKAWVGKCIAAQGLLFLSLILLGPTKDGLFTPMGLTALLASTEIEPIRRRLDFAGPSSYETDEE